MLDLPNTNVAHISFNITSYFKMFEYAVIIIVLKERKSIYFIACVFDIKND